MPLAVASHMALRWNLQHCGGSRPTAPTWHLRLRQTLQRGLRPAVAAAAGTGMEAAVQVLLAMQPWETQRHLAVQGRKRSEVRLQQQQQVMMKVAVEAEAAAAAVVQGLPTWS